MAYVTADGRDLGIKNHVYIYRVYQNDWSSFEVDYIHKYGEQNNKY